MAQLQALGWVVADPELKTSAKGVPYARFTVVEYVGRRDSARKQYIQVWAFGDLAEKLKQMSVKKGGYLLVYGSVELVDYVKKDGITHDKQLKLLLKDWCFAQPQDGQAQMRPFSAPDSEQTALSHAGVIYGDRETLPE